MGSETRRVAHAQNHAARVRAGLAQMGAWQFFRQLGQERRRAKKLLCLTGSLAGANVSVFKSDLRAHLASGNAAPPLSDAESVAASVAVSRETPLFCCGCCVGFVCFAVFV